MTQAEGNKLIAEFMGLKAGRPFKDIGHPEVWAWATPTNSPLYRVANGNDLENIYFHSSWDWLKPVVDEIFLHALACPEQVEPIRKMSIVVEIGACWERCVHFIQWYNNQKSKP
jgi:hypothetical protein